jgi:hypothetical protein
VKHPTDGVQDELVRGYCKEAEGLILLAGSHADALRIKEKWCHRFQQECKSMLIINAAAAYLDQIIARQWKK